MPDLPDTKSGMVIGACLTGAYMSRTANLVGVSRANSSRVMIACTKLGEVPSPKHNSGPKSNLKDRDRRV
ncbi:hypothetical protein TNCV_3681311 [Trichonephila clavipes]|uniref:Uncharacterized protein n=1 Tax=Trichonephila clavipes TaxID=2585209 RepID=A0A8X6RJC1_TRICX|nr:hypothetical protein TNCV_3681311 [Trichonephila clavipes]